MGRVNDLPDLTLDEIAEEHGSDVAEDVTSDLEDDINVFRESIEQLTFMRYLWQEFADEQITLREMGKRLEQYVEEHGDALEELQKQGRP